MTTGTDTKTKKSNSTNTIKILIIILMVFIVLAGLFLLKGINVDDNIKTDIEPDDSFLNVYDEEIQTPNKTYEYNNTVMAGNGKLFRTQDVSYEFDKEIERKNTEDFLYIFNAIKDKTSILYVQRPCKYNAKTDVLPYGYSISLDEKYDYWIQRMSAVGVPVLDLRDSNQNCREFYYGDHHWIIASSYYSTIEILKSLQDEYKNKQKSDKDTDENIYNKNLYKRSAFKKVTRDGFLGEEALRSDKLFMGSEKITFLIPKYHTDFEMDEYDDGVKVRHTEGKFEEALIDSERLNEKEIGKYNACLYAANNEVRIINHTSKNKKKILLIGNSLGRSMTLYLSLGFFETRYIDPQQDRFNESIIEYTDEYKPDFVVVMFNQSIKKK